MRRMQGFQFALTVVDRSIATIRRRRRKKEQSLAVARARMRTLRMTENR